MEQQYVKNDRCSIIRRRRTRRGCATWLPSLMITDRPDPRPRGVARHDAIGPAVHDEDRTGDALRDAHERPRGGEHPPWRNRCAQHARPIASAQPSTRTTQWLPILQRAANRRRWTVMGPEPGSAFSAGLWRQRSTMAPLDSQPAATILQTENSRRSTTIDEKCHPRQHHHPAA
jgi:hypothetical protein